MLGGVVHRAPDRLDDRCLVGLALAPVQPWVDVVTVVRHLDVVLGCPDEAADRVLRVDEAIRVDDLDGGQLDAGRDTDDADAVLRRGDGPGHVRSVVIGGDAGRPPRARRGVRGAGPHAVHRLRLVHHRGEVLVVGVDSVVQNADGDRGATQVDPVGRARADENHVALAGRVLQSVQHVLVEFFGVLGHGGQGRGPGRSRGEDGVAVRDGLHVLGERGVGGARDDHADLRVRDHDLPAGLGRRGGGTRRVSLVDGVDDVAEVRADRVRHRRGRCEDRTDHGDDGGCCCDGEGMSARPRVHSRPFGKVWGWPQDLECPPCGPREGVDHVYEIFRFCHSSVAICDQRVTCPYLSGDRTYHRAGTALSSDGRCGGCGLRTNLAQLGWYIARKRAKVAKEKELIRRGVRQLVTHAEDGAGRRCNGR